MAPDMLGDHEVVVRVEPLRHLPRLVVRRPTGQRGQGGEGILGQGRRQPLGHDAEHEGGLEHLVVQEEVVHRGPDEAALLVEVRLAPLGDALVTLGGLDLPGPGTFEEPLQLAVVADPGIPNQLGDGRRGAHRRSLEHRPIRAGAGHRRYHWTSAEEATLNQLDGARILVIGGAGFLGSHIVDQLRRTEAARIVVLDNFIRGTRANLSESVADSRVEVVEGSIEDRELVRGLMGEADFAFHLAALWLYECVHEPRSALEVNVVGTYNVVEAAADAGVRKVVYSSSASVYGDAAFTPMTEEHPFNNRTMYGATKIAGEQFFRAFNEQRGLQYTGLRYMNIYGPRMDYQGTYVSVIMKVLDRIEQGLPPVIFGDGSQAYDFVHVEDVARANILALTSDASDENFNIGIGVKTTIRELVDLLLEITGSTLEPEYRPQEQMFVTHRVGSTEKAQELLGFRAEIPLRDGLQSVVDWRRREKAGIPIGATAP